MFLWADTIAACAGSIHKIKTEQKLSVRWLVKLLTSIVLNWLLKTPFSKCITVTDLGVVPVPVWTEVSIELTLWPEWKWGNRSCLRVVRLKKSWSGWLFQAGKERSRIAQSFPYVVPTSEEKCLVPGSYENESCDNLHLYIS